LILEEPWEGVEGVLESICLSLLSGAIGTLVIGETMAVGPHNMSMDEGGAVSISHIRDDILQQRIAFDRITTIDLVDIETRKTQHQFRDGTSRCVDLDRDADGISVVLDHEQHGKI
jgi:hypothetical protein